MFETANLSYPSHRQKSSPQEFSQVIASPAVTGNFFKENLMTGMTPSDRQKANVVMIFKKQDKMYFR